MSRNIIRAGGGCDKAYHRMYARALPALGSVVTAERPPGRRRERHIATKTHAGPSGALLLAFGARHPLSRRPIPSPSFPPTPDAAERRVICTCPPPLASRARTCARSMVIVIRSCGGAGRPPARAAAKSSSCCPSRRSPGAGRAQRT
eukprot:scaffold133_cov407-Prasinococcus_capsulatus_cf.AAC.30